MLYTFIPIARCDSECILLFSDGSRQEMDVCYCRRYHIQHLKLESSQFGCYFECNFTTHGTIFCDSTFKWRPRGEIQGKLHKQFNKTIEIATIPWA